MTTYTDGNAQYHDRADDRSQAEIDKGLKSSKVIGRAIGDHYSKVGTDISPSELKVKYNMCYSVQSIRSRFTERDRDRHPIDGYLLRTAVKVPSLCGGEEARYTKAPVDVPAGTQFSLL